MSNKKPVLHELLAVEKGEAETSNRLQKEATKKLSQKETIFSGMTKEHVIFADDQQKLKQALEVKEVQTTVKEQLDYVTDQISKYWNTTYLKDEANQRAKGDIIIDGKIIAKDVPSTTLLGMETKLKGIVAMYNAIPTLDAATAWELDPNYAKAGVYRTKHVVENQQSVKSRTFVEASPATREHRAQVVEQEKVDVIGKFLIHSFSGATTSLDKAEKIQRLTNMIKAVQKARQRSNNTEVSDKVEFAESIFNYING